MKPLPAEIKEASDEKLVRLTRAGSLDCFDELVRRYQVPLLRFLVRRSPESADAEDVLQESFLRAYQSLEKYREEWPFRTWLFTLSYRLSVSMARKRSVMTESNAGLEVSSEHEGPAEQLEREESSQRLWDVARRALTEEQFGALWLHYVESMPAREVGEVMGKSWVWAKTALHRSRRKIEAALISSGEHAPPAKDSLPNINGSCPPKSCVGGVGRDSSRRLPPDLNLLEQGYGGINPALHDATLLSRGLRQ